MTEVRSWLDGLKPGYGAKFASSFDELGVDELADLSLIGSEELVELHASLSDLGARTLDLKKISKAIEVVTGSSFPSIPVTPRAAHTPRASPPYSTPTTVSPVHTPRGSPYTPQQMASLSASPPSRRKSMTPSSVPPLGSVEKTEQAPRSSSRSRPPGVPQPSPRVAAQLQLKQANDKALDLMERYKSPRKARMSPDSPSRVAADARAAADKEASAKRAMAAIAARRQAQEAAGGVPDLLGAALRAQPPELKKKQAAKAIKAAKVADISDEHLARVEQAFDQIDADRSGIIELEELKHVLGGNTLKLFCLIDSDDNGYIERSDWVGWFVQLKATCGLGQMEFQLNFMEMNVDKLKNPPKVYSDSDEELNQEAFRKAATAAMRKRANEEKRVMPLEQHVRYLFDYIDQDDGGDGYISKQEMVRAYGDGCGSLFRRIDSQGRGEISFDDWRDYWVYEMAGTTQKEKLRDHSLQVLEEHLKTKDTNDRKQRRQYYQMARSRKSIGRSARFSRRPGREGMDPEGEAKDDIANRIAQVRAMEIGNSIQEHRKVEKKKGPDPQELIAREAVKAAVKAAQKAEENRITLEYAIMQRKQADEKRKQDILNAERKRVQRLEELMDDLEDY